MAWYGTLFQEDAFQQGVLIAQHQALVSRVAMSSLEIGQVLLVGADGFFQLLDVLGPPLTESGLGLAVSLLPFLRRSIDLRAALAEVRRVRVSEANTRWDKGVELCA
jgi:hypothetical protein